MTDKPFSQACENNKQPILTILTQAFANASVVLEIGSGTGQHAVHFARHLPWLTWHTSDQPHYHSGINAWLAEAGLANLHAPIGFTVGKDPFPALTPDAIFSANTAHIMQRHEVQTLMQTIAKQLPSGGVFCQYGPFTQQGKFNSQSNADFHQHLVSNGYGGYRDTDELQAWASPLSLKEIHAMPANNLLLEWHKT